MKEPFHRMAMATTQIDPATEAATEVLPSVTSSVPFPSGRGMSHLVANFNAIVEERAIYYPVAYRFLRELGRGRQGIVYLGLRQGARGSVTRHAIKVFDPGIYANAKKYWTDMGRIAAQTSKLQMVKNPNLVAPDIYEEYNGIGYLQMGLVDGIGIRTLLDGAHLERARRRSTPQEWARFMDVIFRQSGDALAIQPGIAIYIARRILRGLETLHDLGFVHSDVKPANVMLDRLGYVKVIDYGRAVTANEKVTMLLGTPLYMAPEAHRRELATTQSDIYSAGLVLLEMLRGRPLLDKPTSEAELLDIKMGLRDRLPDLLPDHVRQNTKFVEVLRRFLEPDPAKRYATAEEADAGRLGIILVHKQLALAGKDTEYGRELENYLAKLVNPLTGQVEPGDVVTPAS